VTSPCALAAPSDEETTAELATASAIEEPDVASSPPGPEAPRDASEPSVRLRECGNDLIDRTLETYSGNVTKAAEKLGVSRGLIYRRLRNRAQARR
jgi:DNA-binding NtrC family response regulator